MEWGRQQQKQQLDLLICLTIKKGIEERKKHIEMYVEVEAKELFKSKKSIEYWSNINTMAISIALTSQLSTPLALNNCSQIHLWLVRGLTMGSKPEGQLLRWDLATSS